MGLRKLGVAVLFLQLLLVLHLINSALGGSIFPTKSTAKVEASNQVVMPEKGAAGLISVNKEMVVEDHKREKRHDHKHKHHKRKHHHHDGSSKGSLACACPNFVALSALAFLVLKYFA